MVVIWREPCGWLRFRELSYTDKAYLLLRYFSVFLCLMVTTELSAHNHHSIDNLANSFSELKFYTEDYPPYNYGEGDEVKGLAVDLLMMSAKKMGVSIDPDSIRLRPWPHSYHLVSEINNTVLFSTARIDQREDKFLWAGPIASTRIVLLAKKDRNIRITKGEELKNYTIGGILNDVGEQLVLASGYPETQLIQANTGRSLANMLKHGRIDLWAYDERVALWLINLAGLDPHDFEVAYTLQEIDLYYAFHPDVSRHLVESLQLAIDQLKQPESGDKHSAYDKLMEKYSAWYWDLK